MVFKSLIELDSQSGLYIPAALRYPIIQQALEPLIDKECDVVIQRKYKIHKNAMYRYYRGILCEQMAYHFRKTGKHETAKSIHITLVNMFLPQGTTTSDLSVEDFFLYINNCRDFCEESFGYTIDLPYNYIDLFS